MSGKDMDEDWGDDDGGGGGGGGGDDDWGNEGAGGGGGGGGDDDDWNEDGGGGGSGGAAEWDNAEFDDNAEMGEDGEQELTTDIQIANIFYEAEDLVREHPKTALAKFHSVIELCKGADQSSLTDESRSAYFSSLVHIVVLSYQTGAVDDMVQHYSTLLTMIPKVTRNEGAEAIDSVLNAVSNSADFELLTRVYSITSRQLAGMPDTERMLFNVDMKLCKSYIERHDYGNAQRVLDRLHKTCKLADGSDDRRNKGAELIEIYALLIKISFATGDSLKMKSLYEATKDLSAAVKDPRSQSVIREAWGCMFGEEGEWQRAYAELYSAFLHYGEIGNRERAKQVLKYLVVANMLSGGEQNPFDAREAKVFQQESDIAAIVGLRLAYEKCDVAAFNQCLNDTLDDAKRQQDTFIPHHLEAIIRDFQCRATLRLLKAYRRCTIAHIGRHLRVDEARVERIVVGLILDGQMAASIDRQQGWIDLTVAAAANSKKYDAVDAWTSAVNQLALQITQPPLPAFS